ncbi:hypothetical protein [Halomonas sp.]|uniref:hypothetical protein n=1 Tax=Halomonas sp. TaxID=1486246 RepID=UPI00298D95A6|nr:hypothetical protein [Halomonas sp.]MDW7745152.1 hypothetical protein [Halomonas sp.]
MTPTEEIARIDREIIETKRFFAIFDAGCFLHPSSDKVDVAIPMLLREWRAACEAKRRGGNGFVHLQRAWAAKVHISDALDAGARIVEPETKTLDTTLKG